MKKIRQNTHRLSLVFLLGAALNVAACNTGTKDGATNVEDSDAKGKSPEAANPPAEGTSAVADSLQNSDDPGGTETYEKVDPDNGARDADNDGQVD